LHKGGRARALGVTSKARFAGAPDVPTIAEQGLPDYEATLWQGFFAPASLPADLGARISAAIQATLAAPETREKLQGAGISLFESSQAEFKRFFPAEIEKWRAVVKKANLRLE
jgi:tripartite-type tricarboxylate transporter receptor subunit TctC